MLTAVAAVSGGVFVALALAARARPYLPFDLPVSHAVQAQDAGWLNSVAEAISWVGYPPQVDVLIGLLVLVMFLTGRRWEAAGVALAGAGAGVLYLVALAVVDQPRPSPDLVRVASSLPNSAFPSGHETTFTAVLGFLAYLGWKHGSAARIVLVLGVGVCLVAMAWARLYQGQHWLSELLGGLSLGCCWLSLTIMIYRRTSRRID